MPTDNERTLLTGSWVGVATIVRVRTLGVVTGSTAMCREPQHHTDVSVAMAHVRSPPAATDTAFVINVGLNDVSRVDIAPTPSCPDVFDPAHHTVPSRTMHECCEPREGDDNTGGATTPGTSGAADWATMPVVKTSAQMANTATHRRERRMNIVDSR